MFLEPTSKDLRYYDGTAQRAIRTQAGGTCPATDVGRCFVNP